MNEQTPFYAKEIDRIDNGRSSEGIKHWNSIRVGIFEMKEDETEETEEQIGEYTRNYHSLLNTFHPFKQGDKWYALYSKDYTSTRIMSLPECKDICGEKRNSFGFCPVDYYVPWNDRDLLSEYKYAIEEEGLKNIKWPPGSFGFVAGCVWGDDNGWKIQFLDLRDISKGRLYRDDRFGYVNIGGKRIKDCVDLYCYCPDEDGEGFDVEIYGRQVHNFDKGERYE